MAEPGEGPSPSLLRGLAGHPLGFTGLTIILVTILLAVFAGHLGMAPPDHQFRNGLTSEGMPLPPGPRFRLGTDNLGRDMLSRLVFGSRVSLEIGFFAVLIALGVGVLIGVVAGYAGGWLDTLLMRATDVVMTIPAILLAIALAAARGVSSQSSVYIAIGFSSWTGIARIVRGQTLQIKEKEYIEAARALGCSPLRIVLFHVFPNVLPLIIVLGTLGAAGAILVDAGLSYLGLGVPPPAASWGRMISDGQPYYLSAPWILLEPGIAASVVVIGFNLLGRALQEVLDPYRVR